MKTLSILGVTGSIGQSTLQVVDAHPDKLQILAVAAHSNIASLLETVAKYPSIRHVGIFSEAAYCKAKDESLFPKHVTLHLGLEGLRTLAVLPEVHTTLLAITGTTGLQPALDTLRAKKTLALASKEILVLAGDLVMQTVRQTGAALLPIDSEHNAAFQCLANNPGNSIKRLTLTASGGALRDWPIEKLSSATLADTLKHPNWRMGTKITIDSATLANKGLELIEAQHLFKLEPDQLHAILHPQSIIHALMEYRDGSVIAQLCPPSMTFPIQHALLYPERYDSTVPGLNLEQLSSLNLAPIDLQRYPMLRLAKESMATGSPAPGIYNAANEIAVSAFVEGKIPFTGIAELVEKTLDKYRPLVPSSLGEILSIDKECRLIAQKLLS